MELEGESPSLNRCSGKYFDAVAGVMSKLRHFPGISGTETYQAFDHIGDDEKCREVIRKILTEDLRRVGGKSDSVVGDALIGGRSILDYRHAFSDAGFEPAEKADATPKEKYANECKVWEEAASYLNHFANQLNKLNPEQQRDFVTQFGIGPDQAGNPELDKKIVDEIFKMVTHPTCLENISRAKKCITAKENMMETANATTPAAPTHETPMPDAPHAPAAAVAPTQPEAAAHHTQEQSAQAHPSAASAHDPNAVKELAGVVICAYKAVKGADIEITHAAAEQLATEFLKDHPDKNLATHTAQFTAVREGLQKVINDKATPEKLLTEMRNHVLEHHKVLLSDQELKDTLSAERIVHVTSEMAKKKLSDPEASTTMHHGAAEEPKPSHAERVGGPKTHAEHAATKGGAALSA